MTKDLNDLQQAGALPDDPAKGALVIANEVPIVRTVSQLINDAKTNALAPRKPNRLTFCHYGIDDVTGGPIEESVSLFGAESNWGKSAHLVMMADENIKRGQRVLIVSGEDSESIYGKRLLLRRSRVNWLRFKRGTLNKEEIQAVTDAAMKAENIPVFFDARGRSVEWIAPRIRRLVKEYGIKLVAVDYLQALDHEKAHQDKRNSINYIHRMVTDAIKLSGVAGIIYSQITPSENSEVPGKYAMRESKDITNASENALLGFTPTKPITRKADGVVLVDAGQRCVNLDKNKDGGGKGLFPHSWDDNSGCFNVVEDPELAATRVIAGPFHDFGDQPGDIFDPPTHE